MTDDRVPIETVVALAPTALFMLVLLALSTWLVTGWKADLGGMVFVMAIAWLPTFAIAAGAYAVHRLFMKRNARAAAMFVPWLGFVLDLVVAYVLAMVLLSQ